jgi:hypothetical protein
MGIPEQFLPVRIVEAGLVCVLTLTSTLAFAQTFESVGTRAQGMGGAFVAVADDATATWWNPAGLASGAYMSAITERGQLREPSEPVPGQPAWRNGTSGFAVAYPALGVSYYRLRVSEIRPVDSIASAEPDRQDQRTAGMVLRSVATAALGVTVGQSLGEHLVVASTVRLLRAGAVVSSDAASADALDRADEASVERDTRIDLDLGVMLRFRALRVGGALKHAGEPALGSGPTRIVLARQARAGLALTSGKRGVFDSMTGAVDVDLTDRAQVPDLRRRVALGGEVIAFRNRVAARYGLSSPSMGERRWSGSTGVSLGFRQGLFLDGAVTPGSGSSRAGWSVSLRSSF